MGHGPPQHILKESRSTADKKPLDTAHTRPYTVFQKIMA